MRRQQNETGTDDARARVIMKLFRSFARGARSLAHAGTRTNIHGNNNNNRRGNETSLSQVS